MDRFWLSLRTGSWLTQDRVRGYSLLMIGITLAVSSAWVALSEHLVDQYGKPLGTDFSSFYAAGSLVLEGRTSDVYDMALHYAREQQVFGPSTPYYAWLYPPIFLLIATPLALMPYPVALAVWQVGTFGLYLLVIGMIVRGLRRSTAAIGHSWLLVAAAFPAVFINFAHGQNGFLTASLFGSALVALPTRPIVAGILFGLLAYKPQFALVIPIALLAAGYWRTIAAAAITVMVLVAATAFLFGFDVWAAFAATAGVSRKLLLENGEVGFEKLQSVFAATRLVGGGVPLAYAAQGTISVAVIGATAWAWHSRLDDAQKSTILILATLLASPHVLDYDLTILAPALAFIAVTGLTHGFRDYDISLLAIAWVVPLIARGVAGLTSIPLGLIVVLTLYVSTLRRALSDLDDVSTSDRRLAQA
jgi:alpha-1,2-mannosyltransferase